MTSQLGNLCDNIGGGIGLPTPIFGPSLESVILHCRDPPPNDFRFQPDSKIPILMISAGSGIAAFIGI